MPEISLIQALKLILRFSDSEEVGSVIRATILELDRLYKIEVLAADMTFFGKKNLVDDELITLFEELSTIRKIDDLPAVTPERAILLKIQKEGEQL